MRTASEAVSKRARAVGLQLWRGAAVTVLSLLPWGAVHAALNVFACEPEWAALAQELGGERVTVFAATTAQQDPHRIEARPSLIARMRRADLVLCTGAELEVGWLPMLQQQAGNPRVLPGRPGYFEAASVVRLLERPAQLDRAEGDVHAAGNPHIHTDPRNILEVARALTPRLIALDPEGGAHYQARQQAFVARWQPAIARWEAAGRALRGLPVIVHHRNYSYLIAWLGMREVGMLEPKPGIEPSGAALGALLTQLKRGDGGAPARLILRSTVNSPRAADWLAGRSGLPVVELPATVGSAPRASDLAGFFDEMLARLTGALQ